MTEKTTRPFTQSDLERLHAALLDAYGKLDELTRLVTNELDANLEKFVVVHDRDLTKITEDLIRYYATSDVQIQRLVQGAAKRRPHHVELNKIAQEWSEVEFENFAQVTDGVPPQAPEPARSPTALIALAVIALLAVGIVGFLAVAGGGSDPVPPDESGAPVNDSAVVGDITGNDNVIIQGDNNIINPAARTPTPTPIATAAPDESLILVAPFDGTHAEGAEPEQEIMFRLKANLGRLPDAKATVALLPEIIERHDTEAARQVGQQYNARLVIWGAVTDLGVIARSIDPWSKENDEKTVHETERTPVLDPKGYTEFLTQDLTGYANFWGLFPLGELAYGIGDVRMAHDLIAKSLESLPSQEKDALRNDVANAYFRFGWISQELNKTNTAITAYTEAIERGEAYAEAIEREGVASEEAIERASTLAWAYNNRAYASGLAHDFDGAYDDYTAAIQHASDPATEAWFLRDRGWLQYDRGEYAAAIEDLDRALATSSDYAEVAHGRKGLALLAQRQYPAALAEFDAGLSTAFHPETTAWLYNNKGLVYHDQSKLGEAIAEYDKAIAADPTYAWAYTNRGLAKAMRGEHEAAVIDYDNAINYAANNADAADFYNKRGWSYFDGLQDFENAIQDFQKAIDFNPDYAVARVNLEAAQKALDAQSSNSPGD